MLKELCAYALCAAILLSSAGCGTKTPLETEEVTDTDISVTQESETKEIENTDGDKGETAMENKLNNTYAKLTKDKSLNITYIGGSVTDGYGASDQNTKSWVAHTNDWFKENFPDAKINATKRSIGGTGSYLSAFRYEREIAPTEPDLLFIEYAVNDKYNGQSYENVLRTSETIVRKAYAHNPAIDIVYILTFDSGDGTSDYDALRAHRDVANHYGLINVKMSDYVYAMLAETGDDYSKYFKDGVHPNDEGYSFYATVITETLGNELIENAPTDAEVTEKVLPDMLSESVIENADMVYADEIDLTGSVGFEYQKNTNFSWLGMRYNGRIFSKLKGSKLTVKFSGTDFGICYGIGPNMGIVTCTFDGGEHVVIDAYRANINPKDAVVAWDIEDGDHTAVIEITGANEQSGGCEFEIGALLIG